MHGVILVCISMYYIIHSCFPEVYVIYNINSLGRQDDNPKLCTINSPRGFLFGAIMSVFFFGMLFSYLYQKIF